MRGYDHNNAWMQYMPISTTNDVFRQLSRIWIQPQTTT